MSEYKGWYGIIHDLAKRISKLETEKRFSVIPCKSCDIDPNGSRQPVQGSEANGKARMRSIVGYTQDKEPVATGWHPWFVRSNHNIREYEAIPPGTQGLLFSWDTPGPNNSFFMPGWFTDKDGVLVDSKAFVPSDDKLNRRRFSIEPKEDRTSLEVTNKDSNIEPNTTTAKPDPADATSKFSEAHDSNQTDQAWCKVPDNFYQTKKHEETWDLADKSRTGVHTNNDGTRTTTHENIEDQKLTIQNKTPEGSETFVQDGKQGVSTDKTQTASGHVITSKDGLWYTGKTGGRTAWGVFGILSALWKGVTSVVGGGLGRMTVQTLNPALHQIESLLASGDRTLRSLEPGSYVRMTNKVGSSLQTTTSQIGNLHRIAQSGAGASIDRTTSGDYNNNALKSSVMTAGENLIRTAQQNLSLSGGAAASLSGLNTSVSGIESLSLSGGGRGISFGSGGGGGGGGNGVTITNDEGEDYDLDGRFGDVEQRAGALETSPPLPDRVTALEDAIEAGVGGVGYGGNSTTSLTIGAGSKTLTTTAGMAYQVGSRIRVANDPTHWMEGVVTDYTGQSLTFLSDSTMGAGTYAAWNLSISGQPGPEGPQGEQGEQGLQGLQGIEGPRGYTGDTGAQGPQGETGPKGDKGDKGDQGDQGIQGIQGIQGETGETGATGATGPGYGGTSSTSLLIGTGSKSLTTQAGLAYLAGARIRVAADGANWMEGPITAYTGTALDFTCDLIGGGGTHTSWTLDIAGERGTQGAQGIQGEKGDQGDQGPQGIQGEQGVKGDTGNTGATGPGYGGTSTSNLTIGAGAQSLTTQAGLAYQAGMRVRVAYDASNWMEGPVTSYSSTTLDFTCDLVGGSGAHASWTINAAGERGIQGQQGIQGEQGIQGIQGIQGETGETGATGAGVAAGGATSQVLRKKSNADYDTEWGEAPATGIQFTYSATPPDSPTPSVGDVWVSSEDLREYRWIDDGDSQQWVETASSAFTYLDIDGTLAANSDTRVASQKAVKTYVDALGDYVDVRFPAGMLYGLTLANNGGDATNDIDVNVGRAADSTNTDIMVLASALAKRLDANWAAGTNQGGLDTGSIANTTYHVFLIKNPTSGVVDALFSTSPSDPTMPEGYTLKRRIGSIRRVSGAIIPFLQNGDLFTYTNDVVYDRNSAAAQSNTLLTLSVPTGIRVEPIIFSYEYIYNGQGQSTQMFGNGDAADAFIVGASLMTSPVSGTQNVATQVHGVVTNLSGQVRFKHTVAAAVTASSTGVNGYYDRRGRT